MTPQDFENRLKAQVDFPSPSRVATEIIALARDPDIEMAKVAQAIGRDPAMTAKILRIANSAFYSQRRPSQNLRQALVIIGLNAALTLALSFSLVSSVRALRPSGIDYPRFWRRALLAATGARAFAEATKTPHPEDIFLAALLQDIGVLAIDRASRDFYAQLPAPGHHADWITYEVAKLGKDHAAYTSMLLKSWNLPDRIWQAAGASHTPQTIPANTDDGRIARCLALGSDLAEAILIKERSAPLHALAQRVTSLVGLGNEEFTEVVSRITSLIPETEALYETSIMDAEDTENLLAEARELLAVRNLHALQEVSNLQATTSVLLTRTEEAEDSSRRDPLTGALNRAWLDRLLDREFTQAVVFGRDLSIAHVDIDRFKALNDKFGTPVGDTALKNCVLKLQSCVRGSDLIARYSGEEFMVVLPGADRDIVRQVAQRMLNAIAEIQHVEASGPVKFTISIGLATYSTRQRFPSTLALLEAADHALYAAKLCGRNRFEAFEDLSASGRSAVR
ncbi:diguanylate cyclase (GGDEF)-like protein [Povalibacter uvarum]|uniref:diguanylate cyclase n=1 Tax=Povalibacter uvarum TaxID=732238 RepID=A0A841HLT4_9GAMM|nr:GGDEF domain-containing protein [Povalibacter uvarum]MBB6094037.1 diguanylate cyclase (GGDEF)-like protein [Povalibacter uvarum]